MYNVCLMGASFDTGNQGVSALAASLVGLISRLRPDARISFFIGARYPETKMVEIHGRRIQYEIINHRLSPKASLKEHLFFIFAIACLQRMVPFASIRSKIIKTVPALRALKETDFVGDIRGGDSFSDIYGLRGAVMGSMPSAIALLLGKRLFLLPQTYGPYRSGMAKWIARWVLRRAACILSRDREGVELVRAILGTSEGRDDIHFCPDVAFSMSARAPTKLAITPPIAQKSSEGFLVGLNINGLLFNGGYTRDNMFGLRFDYREFVRQLAEDVLEKTPAHLLLIPHTFAPDGHVESDPQACRSVFDMMKSRHEGRIHLVEGEYDQFEIKGIIGNCDFFIGSRMHACIAALSQGILTIAVAYSQKFRGVFDSIGLGTMVIDARSEDQEPAIERILEGIRQRSEISTTIQTKTAWAKEELEKTFCRLLNPDSNKGKETRKNSFPGSI